MFESILGHKRNIDILRSDILQDRLSHSYLFYGEKGIGKNTVAFEFAKHILDTDDLKNNIDFKYITIMEDKKNILVEQIRKNILDDIYQRPLTSSKKVYIVDNAELLNSSASNALLKTLEEPPKYSIIILISSNISSILPTVLSRVNKIFFSNLEDLNVTKYIESKYNIRFEDKVLKYISGSIGIAEYIITNNLVAVFQKVDELLNEILNKSEINAILKSSDIDFKGKYILDYLQYLLFENNKYSLVEIIEKAKLRLQYNGNYDIVIDNMILKCIERM